MSRTLVVTGAASGLGRATADYLENQGDRVIAIDLREGDIQADLSTGTGRKHAVDEVHRLAPDGIDGIVTWAGLGIGNSAALLVNYFGTVEMITGVHDLLLKSAAPRVVVTSSRMSLEAADEDLVDLLLAGDPSVFDVGYESESEPQAFYKATKTALARWMRRTAVSPDWGGNGIKMNAVAPGLIETAMTKPALADPVISGQLLSAHPQAEDILSQPAEIAAVTAFLLSKQASLLVGQCIFADRGTEAILRGDLHW